MIFQKIFNN